MVTYLFTLQLLTVILYVHGPLGDLVCSVDTVMRNAMSMQGPILQNSTSAEMFSRANPTTVCYNACFVKIYSTNNSMARILIKLFVSNVKTL
jgi:hypothetical protein